MKKLFCLFLILELLLVQAQTIEKYYDYQWNECVPSLARFYTMINKTDSGYIKKDIYASQQSIQMIGKYEDSTCKIENGYFYYFYPNKQLATQGKYIHGKKEGLWLNFHYNGMMSDSIFYINGNPVGISLSWWHNGFGKDSTNVDTLGNGVSISWFDNGCVSSAGFLSDWKQIGKWKYFHKNRQISAEEIYEQGELVRKKYYDENGMPMSDTVVSESSAFFPGGEKAWQKHLKKYIYYPSQYRVVNTDKVVVTVTFWISEDGTVSDVYTPIPFHPSFDKIIEECIKKSPKWIPQKSHNRYVKSKFTQPITFENRD